MVRVLDLEVLITRDVIIQKTRRQFTRQGKAADAQGIYFVFRQRSSGFLEEALCERPSSSIRQARMTRPTGVIRSSLSPVDMRAIPSFSASTRMLRNFDLWFLR